MAHFERVKGGIGCSGAQGPRALLLQIRADRSRGLHLCSKLWVNNGCFGTRVLRVALASARTIPSIPACRVGRKVVGRSRGGAVGGAWAIFGAGRGPASVWSPPHGTRAALQAGAAQGAVLGASLAAPAAAPARPVGTPPGLGRGWEVMGSVGAESPVRPSLLPGRCLAVGQSRVHPGQHFPRSLPQFPHLWNEITAGENAFFLPFRWLKGMNVLGFFFFAARPHPVLPKGRCLREGHPPALLVPFLLLFIFSCSTTKRDGRELKRAGGMIPFTTFCIQGQASFEGGGYAGKNNIFPLFRKPPFLLQLLPRLLPQLPPGMGQGCRGPRWVPRPHGGAEPRCGVGAHGETPGTAQGAGPGA